MNSSTKTRINCADYTIPLSALDCGFDRFMQIFYDNGIECMGIVHNRPKQGVAHCHIVTVPYLSQAEFKKITGITYFFGGSMKTTIPDVVAYLLHCTDFYKFYGAEKYNLSEIKTNIDLSKYRNDFLKHEINLR